MIEGAWVDEPRKVKEAVRVFFQQRFHEPEPSRPTLDGIRFQSINQQQNDMLVGRFQEEEVREAIWDCGSDKSPGPDGLNFKFIKKFWDIMKPDILRFLDEFYVNGIFLKGGNASFIALIPKVSDPQEISEYRPISLIGCIYKIISKLLAKRIQKMMPSIIDGRQSAFIEGRHLLHGVLIANEVVEEARRKQNPCLVFKVDYEKAYDSVSWNFLMYMMTRMGFSPRWIRWIEGCLASASISILVNGSPTKEFSPKGGLQQGDPLAPFLFNIVAEGLNGLMREAVDRKFYTGFSVGRDKVDVTILQYADDTIFFGEASMENIKAIKTILRTFELVLGLKINFAKAALELLACLIRGSKTRQFS